MQKHLLNLLLALSWGLLLPGAAQAAMTAQQIQSARAEAEDLSRQTLDKLYAVQPMARRVVEGAAGYATFNNFGMKIFIAGGGSGKGVAVDRKSGKKIFMKMVEVQAGLGFGAKQTSVIWVFDTAAVFNRFVNSGWEIGGQATAAATVRGSGEAYQGALSVSPGVWIYQLTDNGLALELTVKGTKYFKDGDLN